MRKNRAISLIIFVLFGAAFAVSAAAQGNSPAAPTTPRLYLRSPAFSDGGEIPEKYSSCKVPAGQPFTSPPLEWSYVPKDAASLVLITHDMDAPHPMKGYLDITHWLVYNIPPTSTGLPEGVPAGDTVAGGGNQGKNVRNVNGFQAFCPPPGRGHHYAFELYALDTKVDLPPGATRAELLKAIDGHIIGVSTYIGIFHQ